MEMLCSGIWKCVLLEALQMTCSFLGYNQQMMPPPMGPNQMGYSPGNKMPGMGSGQFSHFNSQYSQQPGMILCTTS